MGPTFPGRPPTAVATSLLPSAEQAMEVQFVTGALVCVQVWAKAGLPQVNSPANAAGSAKRRLGFINSFLSMFEPVETIAGGRGHHHLILEVCEIQGGCVRHIRPIVCGQSGVLL